MKVITRRVTCAAHIADHLALLYLLACSDGDGGTMGIQRFHSTAVVYLNVVAIAAAPRVGSIGNCHCSARRRKDRRALRGCNVRAVVMGQFPRKRVLPVSEVRRDCEALRQRPRKNARPHPIGVRCYDLSAAADISAQQFHPKGVVLRGRQQRKLFVLARGKSIGCGHLSHSLLRYLYHQNRFCYRDLLCDLVAIFIGGDNCFFMFLRPCAVADLVHIRQHRSQVLQLPIIQCHYLLAIFIGSHICGEHRQHIIIVDVIG